MVKDPICGMNLDEASALVTKEVNGKKHYFCSKACMHMFERTTQASSKPSKKWFQE